MSKLQFFQRVARQRPSCRVSSQCPLEVEHSWAEAQAERARLERAATIRAVWFCFVLAGVVVLAPAAGWFLGWLSFVLLNRK